MTNGHRCETEPHDAECENREVRPQLSSLRTLAGATSVVVPFAIGVHLASEALALGAGAIAPGFWLRHAYLLVPLVLAFWSFSRTVGLGTRRAEMIRRCALVRARVRDGGGGSTIAGFTLANLVFFGLTQLLEGVPIASASIGIGLTAAVIGSLLSALVVFFWGRSLVAMALDIVIARPRNRGTVVRAPRRVPVVPRAAAVAFSLFVPNRPPPITSLA
jgi:hypothetical protein